MHPTSWKKTFLLLAFTLLPVLLSSCATVGPKFSAPEPPPTGKSVVYVYRQASLLGAGSIPGIVVNGKEELNSMPAWTWWRFTIEPGEYLIEPKLFGIYKKTTARISNTKPGETYYVRLNVNVGYVGLHVIPAEQALGEILKCHQIVDQGSPQPQAAQTPDPEPELSVQAELSPATDSHQAAGESRDLPDQGMLFVNTVPEDATIRILNIRPRFQQGIELEAGRYEVEVAAAGYETSSQWIELARGEQKNLSIALAPIPLKPVSEKKASSQIFVKTSPAEARVRILNIKPQFAQGMNLEPGAYQVEVAAPGYMPSEQWVTAEAGKDLNLEIRLAPAAVKPKAAAAPDFSDPGMKKCATMLQSESPLSQRDGAKILIRRYSDQTALLDLAAEELLAGSRLASDDRYHVDAMAWLCKALGNSRDQKYRSTLELVANQATSRKVRKYAQKSLSYLP